MHINESTPPQDTQSKPLSALDITKRMIAERMPDFMKSQAMRQEHKKRRTLELARVMHYCGPAALPLPNLAALIQIENLEFIEGEELNYIAECIFILSNQTNEDVLFLRGHERNRAITACCMKIHAHNAGDYLCCIREMLEEVKKKHISSATAMTKEAQNLTQQISSLLLANHLDNRPATS